MAEDDVTMTPEESEGAEEQAHEAFDVAIALIHRRRLEHRGPTACEFRARRGLR